MFGFGNAISLMQSGKRVARTGWNGKNMYVYLHTFPGYEPCFVMHTALGQEQPGWLASQADMLAVDWMVLN